MARTKRSGASAATPKPKKQRFAGLRQIGVAFQQARQIDPSVVWWMLGTFVAVLAVFVLLGVLLDRPGFLTVIGLPIAVLAAFVVMVRRTERAAYRQLEGQPGAGAAALQALRRGWFRDEQPVAIEATRGNDPTNAAMVFRAVGRPGVVLVLEGPVGRAQRLGESERKRVNRVLPNVPVHLIRVGDGADEVPVRKLVGKLNRMRPALTKDEVIAVNRRLRALGAARPPVPKGMDPLRARPDRRGMRGR
jgi:Domain of unknown function (DUF4191)